MTTIPYTRNIIESTKAGAQIKSTSENLFGFTYFSCMQGNEHATGGLPWGNPVTKSSSIENLKIGQINFTFGTRSTYASGIPSSGESAHAYCTLYNKVIIEIFNNYVRVSAGGTTYATFNAYSTNYGQASVYVSAKVTVNRVNVIITQGANSTTGSCTLPTLSGYDNSIAFTVYNDHKQGTTDSNYSVQSTLYLPPKFTHIIF